MTDIEDRLDRIEEAFRTLAHGIICVSRDALEDLYGLRQPSEAAPSQTDPSLIPDDPNDLAFCDLTEWVYGISKRINRIDAHLGIQTLHKPLEAAPSQTDWTALQNEGNDRSARDAAPAQEPSVTRVAVIVHGEHGHGLEYESYQLSDVELSYQDDGRTLKIFSKRNAPREREPSTTGE